jgi:hypothetical protein
MKLSKIKSKNLKPWVKLWWNTSQFHIFIKFFQEETTLKRRQEVKEFTNWVP